MTQIIHEGKEACVRFSGQLSSAVCEALDLEVDQALLKKPETVVFDLAEVSFVASVFLRICLKTFKKMGRDHFCIINVSPALMRVFAIAGLDEMVKTT
ncbi:MAG: STAS domain-containing protein [bacterium]